jgi:hypothetical protein
MPEKVIMIKPDGITKLAYITLGPRRVIVEIRISAREADLASTL